MLLRRARTYSPLHSPVNTPSLNFNLAQLVSVDLITTLVRSYVDGFGQTVLTTSGFDEILSRREDRLELPLGTWIVGTVLAILRDTPELGLGNLDITSWMQANNASLLEYFPDLKIPDSAGPFIELIEKYKQEQKLTYSGIQKSITNYFFLNFLQQQTPTLNLLHQSDRQTRHTLALINILNLHILRTPHPDYQSLVLKSYKPDLWTIGFLRESDPEAYLAETEIYLRDNLIRSELAGYAAVWLRGEKYYSEIQAIKYEVSTMNLNAVREIIKAHYSLLNIAPALVEQVLATADKAFLQSTLVEIEISKLIQEDVNEFVEEHYPVLRSIVWSAFNFRTEIIDGSEKPLIDSLTIAEAEYLVRKIMSVYFSDLRQEILAKTGEKHFDPHLDANKLKNRVAYEDWKNVLNKINDIRASFGEIPQDSAQRETYEYRVNRAILYYLTKKLATAGIYDLSIPSIRERFSSTGFLAGLEDSETMREHKFEINSFNKLLNEVLLNTDEQVKLVIGADNHGEIIYLLGLIQVLLEINPNITVFLIPRGAPTSDDAYYSGIREIFEYDLAHNDYFAFLHEQEKLISNKRRFFLIREGPDFQGVNLRTLSEQEFQALTISPHNREFQRVVYLGIGNANFVSTQGLETERYYLFRVKAIRVAEATGIPADGHPLILAYTAPGDCIGTSFGAIGKRYLNLHQYFTMHPEYFDPPQGIYKNY